MNIRFVERADIDKIKWNSCIHYAINGNVFGYMWFLDNVAKEWDGLVEGDYESVMPVIGRPKYLGVKELYQPDIIRESGIYSINTLSPKRIKGFFEALPEEYKVVNIHLNEQHQLSEKQVPNGTLTPLQNHQLYMGKSHEDIAADYSPDTLQKLERANLSNLTPTTNLKPEKLVDFYKQHTTERKNIDRRYHEYLRIMYNCMHRGWGMSSAILDKSQNVLAAAYFIYSHSKVIRLFSASSPDGQQKGADTLLFDMLIRTHCGKPSILDFNSSDDIYTGFGAAPTVYQHVKMDYRKWRIF